MKLILVSGNGIGAGKTTLASKLGVRMSLADQLRTELTEALPGYRWYDRSQAYKSGTPVPEWGGVSVREVMVRYGQAKCVESPTYWADRLVAQLRGAAQDPALTVAVDDIRKLCEVEALRAAFPGAVHFHIQSPRATHEPEFENAQLAAVADFIVQWRD